MDFNESNNVNQVSNSIDLSIDDKYSILNDKYKKSCKKNLFLTIFSILCIVIFIALGVSSFILYKNIKPLFRSKLGANINIASISQMSKENALDLEKFTKKLAFIDDIVNLMYYYDKDNTKIEDAMFSGYLKALGDKYAEYLPAKEFEEFTEKTTVGVYYGIGCLVNQDPKTKECSITQIYENSPAEKAGLKENDIFVSVDGANVKNLSIKELTEKIKGPAGTKRIIEVFRPSENKNVELVAYTGKVDIKHINSKILEGNIGYIDIDEFTGKASPQFKKEVDKLVSQNIKGLILDCRGNPGGELITVCEMIDYLVKDRDGRYTLNQVEQNFDPGKTLIVYIKEKEKIVDAAYADDNHSVEIPMVVLTDYSTASAAELFTAVLKDYKKATQVGIKTYGKGVVQNMIPYDDGSAIKFTVSEYFPPSGYSINMSGLLPDYSVDIVGEEVEYDEDNNIVVTDEKTKVVFDRDGKIISETDIDKSTPSTISTNSIASSTEKHIENLKIYDYDNKFLDEDWYMDLDNKYSDKQLLQGIIVLKDKIK